MSRRSEAAAYWERSDHALEWARKFIGLGENAKSVQDSYLAAFYAAKATLAQLNIRSKYHTSVMNRVTALVRDGSLASGTDDTLAALFALRNDAAYRVARGEWTESEATQSLEMAERFIGEMKSI